jgi:hypothetical protein
MKMMNKKLFGELRLKLTGFTCLLSLFANAQQVSQQVVTSFDGYRKQHITEKIFVHTDKDDYLAGEIIWLKIYSVDGAFHMPLNLSTVAYVEISDNEQKQVASEKMLLRDGFGDGSLAVSSSINTGNYKLRVYTNWMKNDNAAYFFEKNISIINSNQAIEKVAVPVTKDYNIGLFPEGGNLVAGYENKLAIKITDKAGKGFSCSGFIKDASGTVITKFQTQKFGIGTCLFTPEASASYAAQFNFSDGTSLSKALPNIYKEGFVLKATGSNKKTLVSVFASDSCIQASAQAFLFIHCRQAIKKAIPVVFSKNNFQIEIDNNDLGDGINHITLFNNNGIPVSERLVFVYPTKTPELTVSPLAGYYKTRSKIELEVGTNAPSQSNLSLAVYKVDSLQGIQQSFIDDYLLLSSDLHGDIESPGWYFSQANGEVIAAMDNLMLTSGWRRFVWDDVLHNKALVTKYPPEVEGQYITGRVFNTVTNQPASNITGYLTVPSGAATFKTSVSDSAGNIRFLLTDTYGAPGIILQTAPADSNYKIEINPAFSSAHSLKTIPFFQLPAFTTETLTNHNIAVQVQKTYNSKFLNHFYNPKADTLPFFNHASYSYLLDNYTRFTTIEEIFREYIPFVNVRIRSGHYSLPLYNDILGNGTFDNDPLLMVDGLPIFSADKLIKFDPLKFKQLDIVTRRYFYGNASFDGIINFTSYTKNLDGVQVDAAAVLIDYASLQLQREFYAPEYSRETDRLNHLPDFRYLLYWEPNLLLNKGSDKKVSFYSSDVKGKFIAVVQGITAGGQPCKATSSFEVE